MLNHCFHEDDDAIDIKKCAHIQRILYALKYYKMLKMDSNNTSINTNELFIDFCENAYIKLLDDYQHIIAMHEALIAVQNTLKEIKNDPTKSLEDGETTVSSSINTNKEEVDLGNVTFPHYEEALDASELQTITISGVFSGGPKQNWKLWKLF